MFSYSSPLPRGKGAKGPRCPQTLTVYFYNSLSQGFQSATSPRCSQASKKSQYFLASVLGFALPRSWEEAWCDYHLLDRTSSLKATPIAFQIESTPHPCHLHYKSSAHVIFFTHFPCLLQFRTPSLPFPRTWPGLYEMLPQDIFILLYHYINHMLYIIHHIMSHHMEQWKWLQWQLWGWRRQRSIVTHNYTSADFPVRQRAETSLGGVLADLQPSHPSR